MNKIKAVLTVLALTTLEFKDDKTSLSKEQVEKLQSTFKEKFGKELKLEGLNYDDDNYASFYRNELEAISQKFDDEQAALDQTETEETADTQEVTADTPEEPSTEPDETPDPNLKLQSLQQEITQLRSAISQLAEEPEAVTINLGQNSDHMNKTQTPAWSQADATRPWNQRAAAMLDGKEVNISASSSTDYSQLIADLGDYYNTRFKDEINSFIVEMDDLRKLFPMYSNIQDRTTLVNSFMSEFSQAFQHTFTVKGEYVFQPEELRVYDVKFDHKFSEMKDLEKNWLGYLNNNGSDAIKMPFVKWLLRETMKKLKNEQQQRRINGVYKAPSSGVAGSAINAADGLRKVVKKKIEEKKLKPFSLGEITSTNVIDKLEKGYDQIPEHIRNNGQITAYVSDQILHWYKERHKALYGTHMDYVRGEGKLLFRDCVLESIPNMGSSQRIIWTYKGNIILLEDKPGEMAKVNLEQEDRTLKAWSDWKEGIDFLMVGKEWSNLDDADYEHQMVWVNDIDLPSTHFIAMEADDTTPSVKEHTSLVSVANTQATAITDIDDMEVGDKVILKCGSDTNAITIAKSGNFSNMSAAWTPDKGDTITLYKRAADDIVDLSRTTVTSDAIVIDADDTTPDVSDGTKFVTQANSGATAITSLDNAEKGETYTIYGGSDTNASTIANSGEFDLTGAMTLEDGKYIVLYARDTDDFLELERG